MIACVNKAYVLISLYVAYYLWIFAGHCMWSFIIFQQIDGSGEPNYSRHKRLMSDEGIPTAKTTQSEKLVIQKFVISDMLLQQNKDTQLFEKKLLYYACPYNQMCWIHYM